jgi:hypothetical protein
MNKSKQIPQDKLEQYAQSSLKDKQKGSRGPKTLEGKMKSLANLRKKPKKAIILKVAKRKSDFDFTFNCIDKEKNYTKNQKKHYIQRFNEIVKYMKRSTDLSISVVHNLLLLEIDIKNLFRLLANHENSFETSAEIRKVLLKNIEAHRKLFNSLNPDQYGRQTHCHMKY